MEDKTVKLSKLFKIKKIRKYPISRDREGLSLRARCFEQFDQGKRPAEVAEELNMKMSTVCRYFRDWKLIDPDFQVKYAFVKELLKKNSPDREYNIELFARMCGILKEQFEAILSQPHGLKRFIAGKFYFPVNADADHKRTVALELAILISDHLIKNGGKCEDIFFALRQYMRKHKAYREEHDVNVQEWNKLMVFVHKVLAVDMENERIGRVKPDRLSEEECNALMKWGIEKEKKSTETLYWVRIGTLIAAGLTQDQAREKIYQDLLDKGNLKVAKMMREFQDKVHPVQPDDQMSPSSPSQPPSPT